mmetsp:Transcript_47474/g.127037  ORF Transcript_47474/g.127037 Transcript_47474/m.127037 type:complete len:265 (-) Transcript_47474:237-1031(-)
MRTAGASSGEDYGLLRPKLHGDNVLEGPVVQRRAPDPREGLAADGADRAALVHRADPAALASFVLRLGLRLREAPLRLLRPRGRLLPGRAQPEERRADDEVAIADPLGDRLHPAARLCAALPLLQQRAPAVERVVVLPELLAGAEAQTCCGALEGQLVKKALQHHVDGWLHLQVAEGVRDPLGQVRRRAAAGAAQVLLEQEDELHQEQDLAGRELVAVDHLLPTGTNDLPANGGRVQRLRGILHESPGGHLLHELTQPGLREAN